MDANSQGSRRRKSSSNPMVHVDSSQSKPRQDAGIMNRTQNIIIPLVSTYALKALALLYGLVVLFFFAWMAIYEGLLVNKPSKTFWHQLEKERQHVWDLSVLHPSGLRHAFYTTNAGVKLHYLIKAQYDAKSVRGSTPQLIDRQLKLRRTKNLVIFLHGFPDSASLWTQVMSKLPDMRDCTLVAPDLPGFGGSDGLKDYGPNNILQAVLDFVVAMREQYLSKEYVQSGKVILVAFDWGGVIGLRLASDAPEIADRFIIANAALSKAVARNIEERFRTAGRMLSTWRRTPTKYGLLMKAWSPLKPIYKQLERSGYVFAFNLPWLLAVQTVTRCDLWLVRLMHSLAQGHKSIKDSEEVIASLAGFLGPIGPMYDPDLPEAKRYGDSACKRYEKRSGFAEAIRYYREGLATRAWAKNLDIIIRLSDLADYNTKVRKRKPSTATSALPGALGVPVTVVFGAKDPALDTRIVLEGLDEYMTRGSQIIKLPLGHWVPKEGEGPLVMATVIEWALGDEKQETLVGMLKNVSSTAIMTLSK